MYPIIIAPHQFGIKNNQDLLFLPLMAGLLKHHNKKSDIYFPRISQSFDLLPGEIKEVPIKEDDISEIGVLEASYIHLSTNPENFELFCIKRFFYLKALYAKLDIQKAFVVESDVFTFNSMSFFLSSAEFNEGVDYLSERKCISTALITSDFLNTFCEGVLSTYQSEQHRSSMSEWYHSHISSGNKGGICDMTFCDAIQFGRFGFNKMDIGDFSAISKDASGNLSFDSFIGRKKHSGDEREFKMSMSPIDGKIVKSLTWDCGRPVGSFEDGTKVALNSLHYQGSAKSLMGAHMAKFINGTGAQGLGF